MLDNHSAVDWDLLLIALFLEWLSRHASLTCCCFQLCVSDMLLCLSVTPFATIGPFTQHAPWNPSDDSIGVLAPEKTANSTITDS